MVFFILPKVEMILLAGYATGTEVQSCSKPCHSNGKEANRHPLLEIATRVHTFAKFAQRPHTHVYILENA